MSVAQGSTTEGDKSQDGHCVSQIGDWTSSMITGALRSLIVEIALAEPQCMSDSLVEMKCDFDLGMVRKVE